MKVEYSFENKNFSDLNPIFAGYEDCDKGHSFGPAIRSCYLIHYVTKGSGTFTHNLDTYALQKGDIFIIKPGELTYYKADEHDPWSYTWIGFHGNYAARMNELKNPIAHISASAIPDCFKLEDNSEYAVSMLFLLFSQLFDSKPKYSKYINQIADYITYNYMDELSVEKIAAMVNLDRRYASRIFKEEYGLPISSFLIKIRMEHAKEFLDAGYSVSQSAKMVGYHDIFNFSKMFKKYYGVSPGFYKNT